MGNSRGILLLLVFLIFAALGFGVANQAARVLFASPTPEQVITLEENNQQNILLVGTDDLTSPQPELVSVWVAFLVYFEDQPYMNFKLIYPDPGKPNLEGRVQNSFVLNQEGTPVPEFFQEISRYNITWNGYLLYDRPAAHIMQSWLDEVLAGQPVSNGSDLFSDPNFIITEEAQWLQHLCQYLSLPPERRVVFNRWGDVLPHHMETDIQFESLALTWEKLTTAQTAPHCKILNVEE